MAICRFCYTEIPDQATICRGCGAVKGFSQAQGVVYGARQTKIFGIFLPAILAAVPLAVFGLSPFILPWAAVMAVPIAVSIYRLAVGGVWYRRH